MAYEGDRPGRQILWLGEAAGPEPAFDVDEPHPVAATKGHLCGPGDTGQTLGQGRHARDRLFITAGEDDGGLGPGCRSRRQLLFQLLVRHPKQDKVHRLGHTVQRRLACVAHDVLVARVDGEDLAVEPTQGELEHHLFPEGPGTRARPDHRDGPGLEHGSHAHWRGPYQRRRRFRSARISRAAFAPGAPVTSPPGCAPDPHRYRPPTGIR